MRGNTISEMIEKRMKPACDVSRWCQALLLNIVIIILIVPWSQFLVLTLCSLYISPAINLPSLLCSLVCVSINALRKQILLLLCLECFPFLFFIYICNIQNLLFILAWLKVVKVFFSGSFSPACFTIPNCHLPYMQPWEILLFDLGSDYHKIIRIRNMLVRKWVDRLASILTQCNCLTKTSINSIYTIGKVCQILKVDL